MIFSCLIFSCFSLNGSQRVHLLPRRNLTGSEVFLGAMIFTVATRFAITLVTTFYNDIKTKLAKKRAEEQYLQMLEKTTLDTLITDLKAYRESHNLSQEYFNKTLKNIESTFVTKIFSTEDTLDVALEQDKYALSQLLFFLVLKKI